MYSPASPRAQGARPVPFAGFYSPAFAPLRNAREGGRELGRVPRFVRQFAGPAALSLVLFGCTEAQLACQTMCRDAGYTAGQVQEPRVTVCECEGEGDGLTQAQCDTFCWEYRDANLEHGFLDAPAACYCDEWS